MNLLRSMLASRFSQSSLLLFCIGVVFFSASTSFGQSGSANQSGATSIVLRGGVEQVSVHRLGVNLGDRSYLDSVQLLKNLVFANPGFEGVKSQGVNLSVVDRASAGSYVAGSGDAGWQVRISGGGTISTETSDLSAETPGRQALLLSAGGLGQSAAVSQDFDAQPGPSLIELNGVFSVTFRAKGVGGNNQLKVNVGRQSGSAYLNQTVRLSNGWQDYTLTFSADESGTSAGALQLALTASGGNVELDDVALQQSNTSGSNPTIFRDDVVNALKELNPGTIRMQALGSDIPNQLQAPFARYSEVSGVDGQPVLSASYGIHEFLQLCQTVGADPWITIPAATTPAEMTDLVEYLTGNGSDTWSGLRIARGQSEPWTAVFGKVHIELGNGTLGSGMSALTLKGGAVESAVYPQQANRVFGAARRTAGFEAVKFDLVVSGLVSSPAYNAALLQASTQHDSIDIAPYLLSSANNESQAAMFGALFAEPELFASPGGEVFQDMQVGAASRSARSASTSLNVSESSLSPVAGSITQAQLNQLMPSAGSGIAHAEHMLQMMRLGIQYQNTFALPQESFVRSDGSTVELWGAGMGAANRRHPQFLTQALANSAIAGNMLQTAQAGANPTWNQPLSSDNVQLQGAHYLQSFAFQNGSTLSMVVFNLNRTTALPVTFSGANAPSGAVEMTQIASASITDNNETSTVVEPATQSLSGFNPAAGLSLPPFSMTLLSWTAANTQPVVVSLPGVPASLTPIASEASAQATAQAAQAAAQTTVTISNTASLSGIDRPGVNLGGTSEYGQSQLLKSLNYANGGYMPSGYWQSSWTCATGGPANSTTNWYTNVTNGSQAYPAGFFVGATFIAKSAATGATLGAGTITASTANTGATGISFTLSPAISSVCNASNNDVLVVKLTAQNTLAAPNQILPDVCGGATFNSSDTSPASTNTTQSLQMPNGCTLQSGVDQTLGNLTNANSTLAAASSVYLNLNGSYTLTFKAKCPVSTCSLAYNFGRVGSAALTSGTVTPTVNSTPGAGWTTYSFSFTGSETGSQTSTAMLDFTSTGTVLMQDADVIEGSTLAGNTTAFRDSVVRKLQALHPGSIRYMDGANWCSDVADEIGPTGNRRWCSMNNFVAYALNPPLGYNDVLALCNFIGSDCWITVGQFNLPADWTTLITWLSTSGWTSTFASAGHKIYLEEGNEAWNTGAVGGLWMGNGPVYGSFLGPNMAAAKAATGYNSSVIKLVGDSFAAPNQGDGQYGWVQNVLTAAQATKNGLPDFVDNAPYMLDSLGSITTSGSNVATTGAPFLDEWAEDSNVDSVTTGSSSNGYQSMYLNQQYVKSTFGVGTAVYEVNEATGQGVGVTQLQLDQIDASVGNALSTAEHLLLMQRDALVSGPINVFTLAGPFNGYNCSGSGCVANVVMPLWGITRYLAAGPGQLNTFTDVDRPLSIAMQVINNAIGSNNNLMSSSQAGTPTFSYAGGQPLGGNNSIAANPAVPYVNCFSYSNGSGSWTEICFNNNLTTAESVTLTGAGAPTGAVSETVFPGASNLITDHNENTYIGPSSIAPAVSAPSATTTSGTTYSIPPASMIALTYGTGGTSTGGGTPPAGGTTLASPSFSPGTGTYSATQTVAIAFPAGATGCYAVNATPTAPTAGTCGSGSTTYAGPIAVASSETVNAIATEAGFINSAVGTATYTINSSPATPTFSVASGTYTSTQTVTIADATSGVTIYYTTNGTTPTTSSTVYTGPIAVSSTETLEAIAAVGDPVVSAVATATYTINSNQSTVTATPVFSMAAGTYTHALNGFTITDATPGATIHYTTNGTTPTTRSPVFSGSVVVGLTTTFQAIAVAPGYSTSALATAVYTITYPTAMPAFSMASGTYTSAQTVAIEDATEGATIYYTTDGTTPTTASKPYSAPISVTNSQTIRAIAVKTGLPNSVFAAETYTIN
jgi:hypothetical protein